MRRIAAPLLLATFATAQAPLVTELDTNAPYLSQCWSLYRGATYAATPTESLPALPKTGAVPTAKLAYVFYRTDPGKDMLTVARTGDGGVTWTKTVVYTVPSTETIYGCQIGAEGHTVFVCWMSNLSGQNAPYNIYMVGSDDQGLNWSAPVLVNTVSSKAGDQYHWPTWPQMAVTRDPTSKNVRAHIVYEYGDNRTKTPNGFQGEERPTYLAVEMSNGKPTVVITEKDISSVPKGKNPDIDQVGIYAKGNIVMASYRNDRNTYTGPGTSFNQMFGTYSLDGGRTWKTDFLLGTGKDPQINSANGLSNNDCPGENMASDGAASFYYIWNDRCHNQTTVPAVQANENLILAWSNDRGTTWKQKAISTYKFGLADIDEHVIRAEGSRVVIAVTSDERGRNKSIAGMNGTLTNTRSDAVIAGDNQGNGNYSDGVQIFISNDRGATFTNQWLSRPSDDSGTVQATQNVTYTSGPFKGKGTNLIYCKNLQMEMRGDVIHVVWEEHWYSGIGVFQGEDLVMRESYDGGKSWSPPVNVTRGGGEFRGYQSSTGTNSDIDSPILALTPNNRAVVGYRLQDPKRTSNLDRPQVAVRASVEIVSKFSGGPGLQLENVPASEAGSIAFVLGTLNPNATPWQHPLFGNLGFEPNLVPDGVTLAFLQLFPVFSATVPAGGGTVKFPIAPDLNGLVHVVGLTYNANTGKFVSFTARNRY